MWPRGHAVRGDTRFFPPLLFQSCLLSSLMPLKIMKCQLSATCILRSFRPIESNVRDTMVSVFIHLTKLFLVSTLQCQGMIRDIWKIMGASQTCRVSDCDYLTELVFGSFQHLQIILTVFSGMKEGGVSLGKVFPRFGTSEAGMMSRND